MLEKHSPVFKQTTLLNPTEKIINFATQRTLSTTATATLSKYLLCIRQCSKCFVNINSFNPLKNSMERNYYFYGQKNTEAQSSHVTCIMAKARMLRLKSMQPTLKVHTLNHFTRKEPIHSLLHAKKNLILYRGYNEVAPLWPSLQATGTLIC